MSEFIIKALRALLLLPDPVNLKTLWWECRLLKRTLQASLSSHEIHSRLISRKAPPHTVVLCVMRGLRSVFSYGTDGPCMLCVQSRQTPSPLIYISATSPGLLVPYREWGVWKRTEWREEDSDVEKGGPNFITSTFFFLFKTSVCLNILTAPLVVWPILFRTIRTTRMTSISRACLTCIYPLRRIYPLRDHWPAHFDTSQQPEPCCGHHGERRYFFDSNAILEL